MEEFKQLKLKDQKQHLAGVIDDNQLYVNLLPSMIRTSLKWMKRRK